jgi:hypothetical protein
MMRGIAARSVAFLLASVFASGAVLPSFGDPCPIHDAGSAELAMMSHAMHSAGPMSHQSATAADTEQSGHSNHKSHHCNCIGAGCCTASVMLPPTSLAFAPAVISAKSTAPLPPAATRGRRSSEHALPFSTAPPLLEI